MARGTLYWRQESVTPSGEAFGRAWVVETNGIERPINDGDPISRVEAERLAEAGDYMLDLEA
jgi:hypothetical protein